MPNFTVIDLTTLPTSQGYVVQGGIAGGRSGTWVSNAGDINNDGISDLLIGAPGTGSGAGGAGRVYVIFGTNGPPRTLIDLAALSPGDGFTIIGQPNNSGGGELGSGTGVSVSNAGDVNGDGIADLIIGADRAETVNGNTGAAYVIYGRAGATRADIALGALSPADGFAIVGGLGGIGLDNSGSARLGFSVSGAGDVNGDGLADVIVGAPMAIGNSGDVENPAGQAFVIYGRAGATRATINVDALAATDGFSISGSQSNPFAGVSVSGAGDFNNDGFADVIVGASRIDAAPSAGTAAYVIFGQAGASRTNVALDNPASYAGARIQVNVGEVSGRTSGNRFEVALQEGGATDGLLTYYNLATINPIWIVATRVSSAGDVNGDGFADLVIGLPENATAFSAATGARPTGSFIVYGRAGADLADFSVIGSAGGSNQLFGGVGDRSQLGYSVSQAGDINADGIDDFIVGRPRSGANYVVFGRAGGIGDLALTDTLFSGPLTSDRGLTLVVDGARVGDRAGTSVSAAGDVNGDGIADLIVGAPLSDDGGTNAGGSYVVYGNVDFGAILGTDGGETLTGTAAVDIINAKGGNDILDGGANGDLLRGGAGDDLYRVDNAGDRVVELVGEGTDTVEASIAYTLPATVENLIYTGTGAATLTGNGGNNVLDSGTSATGLVTLIGGDGDDVLIVRSGSFAVGIVGGAGNDTLLIDRALAIIPADIENIIYTGTAIGTLIGNSFDNSITGGTGDDMIDGGDGNDVIRSGAGNDMVNGGLGRDLINAGDGNDTLGGGTGLANELAGGLGDDLYFSDAVGDTILEYGGGGTDEVRTALSVHVLRNNVENLTFTNSSSHLGIGNIGDNVITGGTAGDSLFGRAGNDILRGGAGSANTLFGQEGDDIYVIEAAGDSIIEFANQGIDTVQTARSSFVLRAHVENLIYTGTGAFTGIGAVDNNELTGGALADFLSGLDGNDILIGKSGADFLIGGAGSDQYRYEGGETGFDRITDFVSGTDKIALRDAGFAQTMTIDFVQSGAPSGTTTNSTFLYNVNNGILSFDADGNGAGAAVVLAQLNPGLTLAAGDFLFY